MDWNTLPGFEEKYAKIGIKQLKKYGVKVVTALYGAKDENGNPIPAQAGKEDGHGEWVGIESENNGKKMLIWRHPASEGGNVEYGTEFGENALDQMRNDIDRKQELCRAAQEVVDDFKCADTPAKLAALKETWDTIADWGTDKEAEYSTWFNSLGARFAESEERFNANKTEKESLVEKAAALAQSTEWSKTREAFRDLQNEWREIGSAGAADDELWEKFSGLRKSFDEKRNAYFDNLDALHAEAKVKKEQLIGDAQAAAGLQSFKQAQEKMDALMEEWKKAGSAGRDSDEELWQSFSAIRQDFYARRKQFFSERDAARKASIDAKNKLIKEAEEISAAQDYSKEKTERMKELDKEWKLAGYSGKADGDRLWDAFKTAKEAFWEAKREDSTKRLQDVITRKETAVKSIRQIINDLEIKKFETDNSSRIHSIEREISDRKDTLERLEAELAELKNKMN